MIWSASPENWGLIVDPVAFRAVLIDRKKIKQKCFGTFSIPNFGKCGKSFLSRAWDFGCLVMRMTQTLVMRMTQPS